MTVKEPISIIEKGQNLTEKATNNDSEFRCLMLPRNIEEKQSHAILSSKYTFFFGFIALNAATLPGHIHKHGWMATTHQPLLRMIRRV